MRLRRVRVRLRLRGRGQVMRPEDLERIYERQGAWFAPVRSRLLRRVQIGHKRCVLDLGAGTGETLEELGRRSPGVVVGLDADRGALDLAEGLLVLGQATDLPFGDGTFDLVFTQMFFMWAGPLKDVVAEIRRVLSPSGHLVACAEPDHGAAIEHPAGGDLLSDLAESLSASGADVRVARKLGGELARAGFSIDCGIHPCRPIEAARPGSDLSAPELLDPTPDLEFLFIPYFWFVCSI